MRAILVALLTLSCVACSKADVNRTTHDLKAATDSAEVKQLGADLKADARHSQAQLKIEAAKAKVQIAQASDKAKRSLKDAGDKARQKAHDAEHHHDSDSDSGDNG
jgi:cytochrome c biogenesis protein ResB